MTEQGQRPIAVKREDLDTFGCPKCGHQGIIVQRYGRSGLWYCKDSSNCEYVCIALFRGAKKSSIGIEFCGETIYPELCVHPRRGILAHSSLSIREKIEKLGLKQETNKHTVGTTIDALLASLS